MAGGTHISYLRIHDLTLALGAFQLGPLSLELERGQTLVVLGPSGAGKSVLLETVAGFHQPQRGGVELDRRDLTSLPPEQRTVGFMFQDYALFPHLTVAENAGFGSRRDPARGRRALDRLGVGHLADRRPAGLSGGEKQRVALARALATEPKLFLFDEPLAAVDAAAREALRDDLRSLLRELGATSVYVTHDRTEALVLGDALAVLARGAVRQVGPPAAVFQRPVDEWVAGFLGLQVLHPSRVELLGPDRARAELADGTLEFVWAAGTDPDGQALAVRPEDFRIEAAADFQSAGGLNVRIGGVIPLGALNRIDFAGTEGISALIARREWDRLGLGVGDPVRVAAAPTDVIPVRAAD